MNGKTLAERAYDAHVGDDPHPMWEALGDEQRQRWRRSSSAVCARCEHPNDTEIIKLRAQLGEADRDHAGLVDEILKNDPWERDDTGCTGEDIAIEYVRELERIRDGKACGRCDGGLVPHDGCNCGSPADESSGFMHERLCGSEPCPNGCWGRLHAEVSLTPEETAH